MKKIMFNDRYGLTDAVIEGLKTMTRRIEFAKELQKMIDDSDSYYYDNGYLVFATQDVDIHHVKTRYKVGEVVAVAQSYEQIGVNPKYYIWVRDSDAFQIISTHKGWRNKMYVSADPMPHQIRIAGIRCERLQDISDEDCMKEGVLEHPYRGYMVDGIVYKNSKDKEYNGSLQIFDTPREAFAVLIDKVSGRGTWKSNPWVVVYEFELVK